MSKNVTYDVRDTCPTIDKIINAIREAQNFLNDLYKFHPEAYDDFGQSIEDVIEDLPDYAEEIRLANCELRRIAEETYSNFPSECPNCGEGL